MKRHLPPFISACFFLLFSAAAAFSHHSFSAQYDRNKPIKISGTVTKVEWMNPHIYFYVDAKDSLKAGDSVAIDGWRAKDGTNLLNAGTVLLPDGRKVFAGSADDPGVVR